MNRKILDVQVINLNIGRNVSRIFKEYGNKKTTLEEFISLNGGVFTKERCFEFKNEADQVIPSTITKKSVFWKELEKYLLDNGFDHNYWAALLPNNDFSLLNPNQMYHLPFHLISNMKCSCDPMCILARFFLNSQEKRHYTREETENKAKDLKVLDILNLTTENIKTMMTSGSALGRELDVTEKCSFRSALYNAQRKLHNLGYEKIHGFFMDIIILPQDDSEMAKYIAQNSSLSYDKAKKFLIMSKAVGISVSPQLMEK